MSLNLRDAIFKALSMLTSLRCRTLGSFRNTDEEGEGKVLRDGGSRGPTEISPKHSCSYPDFACNSNVYTAIFCEFMFMF